MFFFVLLGLNLQLGRSLVDNFLRRSQLEGEYFSGHIGRLYLVPCNTADCASHLAIQNSHNIIEY